MKEPGILKGQCWISEAEPELGLGFVRQTDSFTVEVEFPGVRQRRRYNRRTAPLRRLEFRLGDEIRIQTGEHFEVAHVEARDGLLWYANASGARFCETQLSTEHRLLRPLERFQGSQLDPLAAFELRRKTLHYHHQVLASPVRGLVGPRVLLLPHQLYVVSEVSQRGLPRALLADEVGLGKTIEAGWILHHLLVTQRIRRVLLIVPRSLVNQWFVEMLRRFNQAFWVPESQVGETVEPGDFEEHERIILAMESLDNRELLEGLLEAQWDMIVVDEAHRVEWAPEAPSLEYAILEDLTARAPGLLLLTATPEQLGLEGHYGRLRLVDPHRFSSWEAYQAEHERYLQVVELALSLQGTSPIPAKFIEKLKDLLEDKLDSAILKELTKKSGTAEVRRKVLLALVDYYGTGRIYFRNSRSVVQLEHFAFPKRLLREHPLKRETPKKEDALVAWLGKFLQSTTEKAFLICSSPKQVMRLKERLQNEFAIRAVEFHEEQPLLARDRNAAFFEDPDGAKVLLSSEIGGEGRNFQFARHLILADLPVEPDVLEQRIGRLDRIGQTNDIQLHVPYWLHSREHVLLLWYQKVFDSFSSPASGAATVHDNYFSALEPFLLKPETAFGAGSKRFDALIKKARKEYLAALETIEKGRDRLIEWNSFDGVKASQLTEQVASLERPDELKTYLEAILDGMGIHAERLDSDALFVEPGDSMFTSYFPALPPEGMRLSFSRQRSLTRNDLTLMSWDHPMVTETMDAILRQEFGNVSAAEWNGGRVAGVTPPLLEAFFILECVAADSWYPDQFFSAEPIRVLLDCRTGKVVTEPSETKLHSHLQPLPVDKASVLHQIPAVAVRKLLEQAAAAADKVRGQKVQASLRSMNAAVESEIQRLKALQGKNQMVSQQEIRWWERRQTNLQQAYEKAQVRLDSFLWVL